MKYTYIWISTRIYTAEAVQYKMLNKQKKNNKLSL